MDMVQTNGPPSHFVHWTELYKKEDRLHPAIIIILDIIYGFESLKHILEQSLILVL